MELMAAELLVQAGERELRGMETSKGVCSFEDVWDGVAKLIDGDVVLA